MATSLFPPKARLALLAFVAGGAIAGVTYRSWAMQYSRPKPKFSPCFMVAKGVLAKPEVESGTEPHELENGETVYLTTRADRAVRCATIMGDGKTTHKRLTALIVEENPEARAKLLTSYLDGFPKDASGDFEASAFGLLTDVTFAALPASDANLAEKRRVNDLVECRYDTPACQSRHPIPIVTWLAAGVGVAGLIGAIAGLVVGILARRAAARSVDADAPAPRKKKKKKEAAASAAASLLSLLFLVACQTAARPADKPTAQAGPAHSGAPAKETPAEAPPTVPPSQPVTPPPAATTTEPVTSNASQSSPLMPREAPPNGACPGDMILVEGGYCTDVEHHCLKSWYDKSNKKEVCEEFAPKAKCTGPTVKKRFCIDRFSWPNVRAERPEVMNNFYQAQVKCAAVDKRICTESEWTMSCEGPEMKPFPYGWKRDSTKCNGDHMWDEPHMLAVGKRDPKELARLWKGVPNGAQPECISDYGVPDLPGNTDDIASSETYSSDYRGKFDSVTTGGPWYKGTRNQCRPKIYTHDEGFYYYYLGFRCCAEADGKPTDPRTPKQRKDDWKFSRVEGLGRFTVTQMKDKLEQKKTGKCSCKDKDTLCKTMCGTLLGPGAKDIDLKAPRE